QPRDTARDDLGLAGPRSGHDEQRSLSVRDRPALVRVEAAEQLLESRRLRPGLSIRAAGGLGDRVEAVPDRDLLEWPDATSAPRPDHGFGSWRGWGHASTVPGRRDSFPGTTTTPWTIVRRSRPGAASQAPGAAP